MAKIQCEGWRRTGGAFSLGPVQWKQCTENAEVMLEVVQGGKSSTKLPGCKTCWQECIDSGLKILSVAPITGGSDNG